MESKVSFRVFEFSSFRAVSYFFVGLSLSYTPRRSFLQPNQTKPNQTYSGTRLITGDNSGICCVWKSDARGSLAPSIQYRKTSPLTSVVFATPEDATTTNGNIASKSGKRGDKNSLRPSSNLVDSSATDVVSTLPSGNKSDLRNRTFSPSFFFGSASGIVSYADDLGHCTDVQSLSSSIDSLLFYSSKMRLVIITRSLLMTQLQVSPSGHVTPVMKVKLSVGGDALQHGVRNIVWAGPGLLASVSGENMVRFWDLQKDENFVLTLHGAGMERRERAVSVAFNPVQRYVAVGTKDGGVAMWKFVGGYTNDEDDSDNDYDDDADDNGNLGKKKNRNSASITGSSQWKAMPHSQIQGPITHLTWGPGQGLLAASTDFGTTILSETVLHRCLRDGCAAIQINNDTVSIEDREGGGSVIHTGINVKGVVVDGHHMVVWNGKEAQVYGLGRERGERKQVSDFQTSARSIALRRDTLFMAEKNRLLITNLHGVQRLSVSFTSTEGMPQLVDLNGNYLAVVTDKGVLKLMDVSRKDPKPLGSSGKFVDPLTNESIGAIRSIRVNADGTRLSILSDRLHGSLKIREPDSRLYVYDSDRDIVDHFDFRKSGRIPTSHFWDPSEPKLLSCETRSAIAELGSASSPTSEEKRGDGDGDGDIDDKNNVDRVATTSSNNQLPEVTTMFVTADFGIKMQDVFSLEEPLETLIGLQVPRLYFVASGDSDDAREETKSSVNKPNSQRLMSKVMRDFVGLEDVDNSTKAALLDFSYYLTIGNMDEAYRAVKLIRNPSVWENMAHMCVKTKRLDVAEVCLGNMGHARGAAAVRLAKKEPELEAAVAAVAIQLGLLEDAERLYKECGRFDLLNELYQGQGKWVESLDLASSSDRIHLKTTNHKYAKFLESSGDMANAIRHFERADTYKSEVPRMLFDQGRTDDLEDYIMQGNDTELLKWWAGYCESLGHFDKARNFYDRANDNLSLVRLACHNRELALAADIVNESGSISAAYHLARQLEGMGEVQEAISFFAQSGCFNHAIRLSKAYGLDSELMSFALKSRPSSMVDCAQYFENKGEYDKAVQLYQRGGDNAKALDLCFRIGKNGGSGPNAGGDDMFTILKELAESLGEGSSDLDLERCSDFFIKNGQFEKAVELLYKKGKKYDYAIDLCIEHRVKINEEMAEGLTPPKTDDPKEKEARLETIRKLAKACKKQGEHHLACKKYTQAGDRLKAMKCLLKSGDTEKITYYANVSRNKDIYILAANYLQNLDFHNNADIMKNIITYYTKAKAFQSLAGFYESCAQVEIDEYRDYEKALGALKEGIKYASKANNDELGADLQQRVYVMERFVLARRSIKNDPQESEQICLKLLDSKDAENAIRVGDCFALLIEYYHSVGRMDEAYDLMERMKARRIVLNPYLERSMMDDICRAVGKDLEGGNGNGNGGAGGYNEMKIGEDGDDGSIEESIGEEVDELDESLGSED